MPEPCVVVKEGNVIVVVLADTTCAAPSSTTPPPPPQLPWQPNTINCTDEIDCANDSEHAQTTTAPRVIKNVRSLRIASFLGMRDTRYATRNRWRTGPVTHICCPCACSEQRGDARVMLVLSLALRAEKAVAIAWPRWRAERKVASSGGLVFNDQYPKPERAKHRFKANWPHLVFARTGAVLPQELAAVAGWETRQSIEFEPAYCQFVGARPAGLYQSPIVPDQSPRADLETSLQSCVGRCESGRRRDDGVTAGPHQRLGHVLAADRRARPIVDRLRPNAIEPAKAATGRTIGDRLAHAADDPSASSSMNPTNPQSAARCSGRRSCNHCA
jgi:hypothetical protein